MKNFIRALATLLSILVLMQILPMEALARPVKEAESAAAAETLPATEAEPARSARKKKSDIEPPEAPPRMLGEMEELREENVKHFRNDNNSYTAVMYAGPVHFQGQDGAWQDIDNTLELNSGRLSASGKATYTPTASDLDISVPQEFAGGQKLTVSRDGFTVGLGVSAQNESAQLSRAASVVAAEELPSENLDPAESAARAQAKFLRENFVGPKELSQYVEESNAEMTELDKLSSAVVYENIFPGADLEYIVTPAKVKENIVIKQAQAEYIYHFDLSLGGLIPVPREDGSIALLKSEDDEEPLFVLEAPYMYDAAGAVSFDVEMELSKSGLLTLTANTAWINDEQRVLPVVVDPTLTAGVSGYQSVSVHPTTKSTNNHYVGLFPGTNPAAGVWRTYIQFTLPILPGGSVVSLAQFDLSASSGASGDNSNHLYMYECKDEWETGTIAWGAQPDKHPYVIDFKPLVQTSNYTYNFNITKAVRDWYETGTNYGLMLQTRAETHSARLQLTGPAIGIAYTLNLGLENYWSYETIELGRSGTAHVNHYNGVMTYVHTDISMPGNLLPLNIAHVYTSSATSSFPNMGVGKGFRLNLQEQFIEVSQGALYNAGYRYRYIDGDGTTHYFTKKSNGSISHEYDATLILETNPLKLTDAGNNKKYFNAQGFLERMEDSNGNEQIITWNSSNQITQVEDGSGRVAVFSYDSSGNLSAIADPAGRSTLFSYVNTQGGIYLSEITYPDGKSTSFGYTALYIITSLSYRSLCKITADDSSSIDISYKSVFVGKEYILYSLYFLITFPRVRCIIQNNKDEEPFEQLDFFYLLENNQSTNSSSGKYAGATVVYDSSGKWNNYHFNLNGSVTSVRNQYQQVQFTDYYTSSVSEADRNQFNKISEASEIQTIANNLLRNHGFEQKIFENNIWSDDWTTWISWKNGNALAEYTDSEQCRGERSMLLQVSSTGGTSHVGQLFHAGPEETYTLSADIMIPSELEGDGGAKLGFSWVDSGEGWHIDLLNGITATNGWERVSYTFTFPEDANSWFWAMLGLEGAVGSVYFDNVQLEKSGGSRYYNLVENSDFSFYTGSLDAQAGADAISWSWLNRESDDGIKGHSGHNYAMMLGSPTKTKEVIQTVPVNARAGETIIIGGQGAAYAVAVPHSFAVVAKLYDTNNQLITSEPICIDFDENISAMHQMAAKSITLGPDQECSFLQYSFVYENQVNNASFSNAFVYVGNFGASYEYNSEGLPVSVEENYKSTEAAYDGTKVERVEERLDGLLINSYDYSYDSNQNLTKTKDKGDNVTEYSYDSHGLVTEVKTGKEDEFGQLSGARITETMTYDQWGYPATHTDARGEVTQYTYNHLTGTLSQVEYPGGNIVTYEYDPDTDVLISTTGLPEENAAPLAETTVTTQDGMLSTITRGGTAYQYSYDAQNRLFKAKVDGKDLVTNGYDGQLLITQTYGGDVYNPTAKYELFYDERDRVNGEEWDGDPIASYYYNENDRLSQIIDHTGPADITKRYSYAFDGLLESVSGSDGSQVKYVYDFRNAPSRVTFTQHNNMMYDAWYTSTELGRPSTAALYSLNGAEMNYSYDDLGRPTGYALGMPAAALNNNIAYKDEINGAASGLVKSFGYSDAEANVVLGYGYEYDANGNISKVTTDGAATSYAYDGLNRLISETTPTSTTEYAYDTGGNITSVLKDGLLQTYEYYGGGGANWKDQLKKFDNKLIEYDDIGNPVSYGSTVFSWQRGRQLAGISGDGLNVSYSYDAAGLRTSKSVEINPSDEKTTKYTYADQLLVRQSDGVDTLDFGYDADGKVIGFKHQGRAFFYLRNLQGDITAIVDEKGVIQARYEYDAWGNVTIQEGREALAPARVAETGYMEAALAEAGLTQGEIEELLPAVLDLDIPDPDALREFLIGLENDETLVDNHIDQLLLYQSANMSIDLMLLVAMLSLPPNMSHNSTINYIKLAISNTSGPDYLDFLPVAYYVFMLFEEILENYDNGRAIFEEVCTSYLTNYSEIKEEWMAEGELREAWRLRRLEPGPRDREMECLESVLRGAGVYWEQAEALLALALELDLMDFTALRDALLDSPLDFQAEKVYAYIDALRNTPAGWLEEHIPFAAYAAVHMPPGELEAQIGAALDDPRPGEAFLLPFAWFAATRFTPTLRENILAALEDDKHLAEGVLEAIVLAYLERFDELKLEWVDANLPALGALNPYRYRGYYQDNETGFYFLQTRYYNPEWRRFLNADSLFIAGDDALNGANLYAYCNGNPVMFVDPSGRGVLKDFLDGLLGTGFTEFAFGIASSLFTFFMTGVAYIAAAIQQVGSDFFAEILKAGARVIIPGGLKALRLLARIGKGSAMLVNLITDGQSNGTFA
ncbi:MAG: DNRLRE domain-containing protein, partial [Oscillospiraceae bacterium]|nr:DNRLRE domain-containing protein [Oscillospiraceae bacterium]